MVKDFVLWQQEMVKPDLLIQIFTIVMVPSLCQKNHQLFIIRKKLISRNRELQNGYSCSNCIFIYIIKRKLLYCYYFTIAYTTTNLLKRECYVVSSSLFLLLVSTSSSISSLSLSLSLPLSNSSNDIFGTSIFTISSLASLKSIISGLSATEFSPTLHIIPFSLTNRAHTLNFSPILT